MSSNCSCSSVQTSNHPHSEDSHLIFDGSDVPALIVLALPLGAGEDFFGRQVADALEEAALAKLATDAFVDAILDRVDVLVARDFRLA